MIFIFSEKNMVQMINSKEEFDKFMEETNWIFIADFFATWCGPCQILWPVIEELSKENKDVKFVKIDVDEVPELAAEYQISSIPTVFIGYNHDVREWFLGAHPKEFYEEKIKNAEWELTNVK